MLRKYILLCFTLPFFLHSFPSFAQEADLFGLKNSDLAHLFLEEAMDIARTGSVTRDPFAGSTLDSDNISEFQVLQEAYRADPDATLELIDRILKAGRTR